MRMRLLYFGLILFVTYHKFNAQEADTSFYKADSINKYYFFNPLINPISFEQFKNGIREINFDLDLVPFSNFEDETGTLHTIYHQYYKGVLMNNCSFFARSKGNVLQSANGFMEINISLPQPNNLLSFNSVLQNLLLSINRYYYKWTDSTWLADSTINYYPKEDLRILKLNSSIYQNVSNYKYVYVVDVPSLRTEFDSILTDSIYYIDAVSGNILNTTCGIAFHSSLESNMDLVSKSKEPKKITNNVLASSCAGNCQGGGVTVYYYGGQAIYTEEIKNGLICNYRLHDNCTGTPLRAMENPNVNINEFWSSNNGWPNPNDRNGTTALFCLREARDFYANVLGRNSFDGNNSRISIFLMSGNKATFWDDDPNEGIINIATTSNSWDATIDIVAHEMTHGVNNTTAGLGFVENTIEGALNEGFCDIFGEMAEFYTISHLSVSSAIADWVHGDAQPVKTNVRDFSNPKAHNQPDCVNGVNWSNTLKHSRSGPLMHWFFLLSNGSGGSKTNDLGNTYCVNGIGRVKAMNIAYLALISYIGGTSKQYADARFASIQAASNLYGTNSNEVAQVTAAWYAVGVGANFNGQIDAKNLIVNSPTTTYKYNSKVSLQNVSVNSGGVLDVSSNTEVEVLADFNSHSGSIADLYIAPSGCSGSARFGNTTPDRTIGSGNGMPTEFASEKDNKQFFKETNFLIMPNPTTGFFKLQLDNSLEYPQKIIIRDVLGRIIKSVEHPDSFEFEFSLANEKEGVYVINVYYNDKVISKRVIKTQ